MGLYRGRRNSATYRPSFLLALPVVTAAPPAACGTRAAIDGTGLAFLSGNLGAPHLAGGAPSPGRHTQLTSTRTTHARSWAKVQQIGLDTAAPLDQCWRREVPRIVFGIRSKEERLKEEELREAYHDRILEALQPAAEDSDPEGVDLLVTPLRESAG